MTECLLHHLFLHLIHLLMMLSSASTEAEAEDLSCKNRSCHTAQEGIEHPLTHT